MDSYYHDRTLINRQQGSELLQTCPETGLYRQKLPQPQLVSPRRQSDLVEQMRAPQKSSLRPNGFESTVAVTGNRLLNTASSSFQLPPTATSSLDAYFRGIPDQLMMASSVDETLMRSAVPDYIPDAFAIHRGSSTNSSLYSPTFGVYQTTPSFCSLSSPTRADLFGHRSSLLTPGDSRHGSSPNSETPDFGSSSAGARNSLLPKNDISASMQLTEQRCLPSEFLNPIARFQPATFERLPFHDASTTQRLSGLRRGNSVSDVCDVTYRHETSPCFRSSDQASAAVGSVDFSACNSGQVGSLMEPGRRCSAVTPSHSRSSDNFLPPLTNACERACGSCYSSGVANQVGNSFIESSSFSPSGSMLTSSSSSVSQLGSPCSDLGAAGGCVGPAVGVVYPWMTIVGKRIVTFITW